MILSGGGGATKSPTVLENTRITGGTSQASTAGSNVGALETASVSSSTLTEVLNIVGSGVLSYSAIVRASGSNVSNHKIRITIDGVVVLYDAAGTALTNSITFFQVGAYNNNASALATELPITFNKSLKVEIAGDGTNNVKYIYKRYLT